MSYQLGGKVLIVVKDGGEKLLARAFAGLYVEQALHLACHGGYLHFPVCVARLQGFLDTVYVKGVQLFHIFDLSCL